MEERLQRIYVKYGAKIAESLSMLAVEWHRTIMLDDSPYTSHTGLKIKAYTISEILKRDLLESDPIMVAYVSDGFGTEYLYITDDSGTILRSLVAK